MVSVTSTSRYITSASRYHPRYQSRSSMYIRSLIPRNFAELAEAVPIEKGNSVHKTDTNNYILYFAIGRTEIESMSKRSTERPLKNRQNKGLNGKR